MKERHDGQSYLPGINRFFFDKNSIIQGFLPYDKLSTPYDEDNVK